MKKENPQYRLRNGIVIEFVPKAQREWTVDGKIVSIPEDNKEGWRVREHIAFISTNEEDPLSFMGGAHGDKYDVIKKI